MIKSFCVSMSAMFALVAVLVLMSGCATALPQGIIYTGVKLPISSATGEVNHTRRGTSEAQSYLGLVAVGDASIETAAKNGNITKIKYVDYQATSILGLVGTYKTTVFGD